MSPQNTPESDLSTDLFQYSDLVETISGINYIIDRDYKIALYSKKRWNEFAETNDGDDLLEEQSILRKSVFDFFAGAKVREYYKKIYDLIFEGKREEITIRSNCDAPEVLRDNVIYLTPVYRDRERRDEVIGVFHQSLIMKIEKRQTVELLGRSIQESNSGKFIQICSICKFVNYRGETGIEWIPTARYYELGGSQEARLAHSICPDCEVMLDEFL